VQNLHAKKKFPSFKQLFYISKYLSKGEQLAIRILSGIVIVSICSLLLNFYWTHSTIVPTAGGSYTEGLVGTIRHVNPLFAQTSDADMDLTALTFSGLLNFSENGFTKDLAEDYQISADQKVYTFQLRQDVLWHDGEKFKADDVIFTFERINIPETKTPIYFNFKGAKVEKIDDYTVRFTLSESFAPFLESLTIGILPQHIWENIPPENMSLAEYNLKPIGTGPFKFKSLVKNKNGTIKNFNLERNNDYYGTKPYIDELTFKFHSDFAQAVDALNNKNVEGISYLPKELRQRIINNRNLNFHLLQLPQYTAVFFNYSQNPVLKEAQMRKTLSYAVNKEKIVNEILNAEAQVIDSCILPESLGFNSDIEKFSFNSQLAKEELEKAEWKLTDYKKEEPPTEESEDTTDDSAETPEPETTEEYPFQVRQLKNRYLEFSLTTVDQPENVKIAKELQKEWQQIGAKVNLIFVKPNQMQEVIKNRDYEALLYGQILGYDPDPFPFWHSKQKTYPGLNLTSLADEKIDALLEQARKTSNEEERAGKYTEFQKLLTDSAPAIFLFNPTYTYPQNKKIKGFNTSKIINPSNRFNQISNWFIKTERKWTD